MFLKRDLRVQLDELSLCVPNCVSDADLGMVNLIYKTYKCVDGTLHSLISFHVDYDKWPILRTELCMRPSPWSRGTGAASSSLSLY